MRPKASAVRREIAKVTRSKAFRAAEKKAGYVSVCLIGWDGPRPRYFGDNSGCWPVRVVMTKREKTAAKSDDLSSPHVGVVVLEWVAVPSDAHAKRLKAALDEALMGEVAAHGNAALRHSWRDVAGAWEGEQDRAIWWGVLLEDALRRVRKLAREFDVMTGVERDGRIARKAKRR